MNTRHAPPGKPVSQDRSLSCHTPGPNHALEPVATPDATGGGTRSVMSPPFPDTFGARLAMFPPDYVLTRPEMEWLCALDTNGITRAVKRGDLPAPATIFGRSVWTVQAIRTHIDALIEQASKDAAREKKQRDTKVKTLYGGD